RASPAPPAPLPTTPPPHTSPPPTAPATPTPTPTPTVRVLQYGMEGPDVQALQRQLGIVICWQKVPPTGKYDDRTQQIVMYFQDINGIRGDERGVYGPATRTALEGRTGC
ncbi:peptidoglycan-binding domain-containing protein, partial [Kitasatospora putterlickiae]|uniref:peptidoglycan-binding domain-containing protein n=1 Tax=Kitasatospora putterlickiae TaxID=221725 RepID=UPI0031DE7AA7